MTRPASTCWTVIRGAAAGKQVDRDEFARLYTPLIRAYLAARWHISPKRDTVEDAIQEVFVECFKEGGVLERAGEDPPKQFRAFLYGVARNVARRAEGRWTKKRDEPLPAGVDLDHLERDEATLSRVFDHAWAESIVSEAAAVQASEAKDKGEKALRRIELLRLRFTEGKPIREIAELWNMEAKKVHKQFEQARKEFREALWKVVKFHHPDSVENARRELRDVLTTLGGTVEEELEA